MMEELVDIVNKLQDVFSTGVIEEINLPQIVVVGTQSAGKSSVLEHIVGKSFLPRGTGIVTRCPLVLQLVHARGEAEERAVFQENSSLALVDFTTVTAEIKAMTQRLAGPNKGICKTSINLKIYSSSVLDLTLVDLPGLTKVPVDDQPTDIDQQIKDLVLKYIENPNSIILAVTPANIDMATSESLQLANQVDPKGDRTLAVLTKLDLMDEGTDAWDMLSGKIIPVKLGIVGVVNRSQKDILEGKSIEESLKDEASFLKKNYSSIADFHGTPFLTKKVQAILINHIKKCMPGLRNRISNKLQEKSLELSKYADSKLDKPALLLDLISKFTKVYVSAIKGGMGNVESEELFGGARIHYVFQEVFSKSLKSIEPFANITKKKIRITINNANGMNPAIFVPEDAFELLAKTQIEQFRNPSLDCVKSVYDELVNIAHVCMEDAELRLENYPKLLTALGIVTTELLQDRLPVTNQNVESFIDIQVAHLNTSHPDFLPQKTKSLGFLKKDHGDEHSDDDEATARQAHLCIPVHIPTVGEREDSKLDIVLIQELIVRYVSIVRKNVEDTVPKMIVHFLVNYVREKLQTELVLRLMYKGDVEDLMCEARKTASMRQELEKEVSALNEANRIMNSISRTLVEGTRVLNLQKQCKETS